jgi:hypothetical protein
MNKQTTRNTRLLAAAAALTTVTAIALAVPALGAYDGPLSLHASRKQTSSAHLAGTLNATDTAHLHYLRSSGSQLYEEGTATGTLPGTMRAHCSIGAVFTASFTIYTRAGTITGHGSATPHGSGVYESFSGSVLVTGGTGHYTHAYGHAKLYGTFDRRTYGLIVQTVGRLTY